MILSLFERLSVLTVFQIVHPCAFHRLEGFRDHFRVCALRIRLFHQTVFQCELEVFHLFFRCVARPAQTYRLLEIGFFVRKEIQDAFFMFDQILRRVAGIAAAQ